MEPKSTGSVNEHASRGPAAKRAVGSRESDKARLLQEIQQRGPRKASELASATGLRRRRVDTALMLLAATGVLSRGGPKASGDDGRLWRVATAPTEAERAAWAQRLARRAASTLARPAVAGAPGELAAARIAAILEETGGATVAEIQARIGGARSTVRAHLVRLGAAERATRGADGRWRAGGGEDAGRWKEALRVMNESRRVEKN